MESADSLAVETHVLSERLSHCQLEAPLGEQADRVRVLDQVTACETLVRRVEEWEQSVLPKR